MKRFTIYDDDVKSALELIKKLGNTTNEVIDNFDNKTDVNGDHKGTWQGLKKPTLSNEGMKATVEKLTDEVGELNSHIGDIERNKASKEDIAKISSATPLFVNSLSEMIDITRNYVNLTDGYLYVYSDGVWEKTLQYQSTGIADNSIEYKQVNTKNAFSNINPSNVFDNPTLENNYKNWIILNNDGHVGVEKTLNDSFSKGVYVPKTVGGNSLIQRVSLNKLITGEYIVRCKKRTTGTNYNGRLSVQLSNEIGQNLLELYKSEAITSNTLEYRFTFNKEGLIATYPTAVFLTITFTHATTTSDCTFYEPFLGLTTNSTSYNNFKFETLSVLEPLANNSMFNKIATFNGDSICQGVSNGGGYAKIIGEKENMIIENKSLGGGTIAKGTYYDTGKTNPRHWICDTVATMREDAEYVILEGGRNDYGLNIPLGVLTNDYTGAIDNTTFFGGLEHLFRQALTRFKGKKIGFVIIHKVNAEPYTPNLLGLTFEDYYNAIIKTCEKYSISICDLYKNSGMITAINDIKINYTDNSDGLHPNALGYEKYYTPKIIAWMKTL